MKAWKAAFWGAAVLMAGGLSACQGTPPPLPLAEISFAQMAPYRLDVSRIEIVDEYVPSLRAPNVEHEFSVPPAQAARRWANDRLRAVSPASPRTARFVIRNASVVERKLQTRGGVSGALTTDQSAQYEGLLEVVLEIRSDRGFRDGFAEARAEHSRTVPENITLNDRTKIFHEMTQRLIGDLNRELERQMELNLSRFKG